MQVGHPTALTITPGGAAMTRERLAQLSNAELIEIILQQQATILQQQALIEQLLARVAALEDQIKPLSQRPKDASNSSTPPSKNRKPNRPNRKSNAKRGEDALSVLTRLLTPDAPLLPLPQPQ